VNQLYIGSNGKVAAINPDSGQIKWETKLDTGSGLFSSTAYQDIAILEDGDKVFAGCNGHLFCLNPRTGNVLWHNKLKGWGNNDLSLSLNGKAVKTVSKPQQAN
jgi:outer membrane protein assembly factor BamB